ncbi:MAG: alanine racemase [Candidatus Hydrogenedentes bacterium]|nr:alanine racemase [Candidatus Hydrogenedentota bacterium]
MSLTRVIVDLDALKSNLELVRHRVGNDVGIIAVVKSDAYGLGAIEVARTLASCGVEYMAVGCVDEACELRQSGIETPILVIGIITEDEISAALECDISLTLVSLPFAERLHQMAMAARKVVKVHCNVDTGMGRIGFDPQTTATQLGELVRFSNIDIEGVYTHLVQAHIKGDAFTRSQLKTFKSVLKQIDKLGIPYEFTHVANSAAIFNSYDAGSFDAVRPGLVLYGAMPDISMDSPAGLRDVVRVESRISFLKHVPAATPIGYGKTYVTESPTLIATVPAGYANGIPYGLSNRGSVLIRGHRCPIVGTVTMEQIMVDVGGVPDVAVGDVVTIIGSDGDETVRIEDIAQTAGIVPHAVLTGFGTRIKRVYKGGETTTLARND